MMQEGTNQKKGSTAGRPLLSICIPTYNHAELLKKTLSELTQSQRFLTTNDIELVISDNASPDNTFDVCRAFRDRFPDKIRIFRQEKCLDSHDNFHFVLKHGSGLFLRLHNDNLSPDPGAIDLLTEMTEQYQDSALILTMNHPPAGREKEKDFILCTKDISLMLDAVSFAITWIGILEVRRDVFAALEDPFRYSALHLPHTDIVLRIMDCGGKCTVPGHKFFTPAPLIRNKYDYNHAQVFGQDYLSILKPYVSSGKLSKRVYTEEKKRVLYGHIIPFYFDFFRQYNSFPQTRYWYYTRDYHRDAFYYVSFLYVLFYYLAVRILHLNVLKNAMFRILPQTSKTGRDFGSQR